MVDRITLTSVGGKDAGEAGFTGSILLGETRFEHFPEMPIFRPSVDGRESGLTL